MKLKKFIIFLIILLSSKFAHASKIDKSFHFSNNDIKHAESALYLASKEKWDEALYTASLPHDKILKKIILWLKYKNSIDVNFTEINNFIKQNPNWPEVEFLKKRAELAITKKDDSDILLKYFQSNPPLTGHGNKHLALVKASKNLHDDDLIKQAFVRGNFNSEDEESFFASFSDILDAQDIINRIDDLLWQRKIVQAKRLIPKIDDAHQILFNARIDLIKNNEINNINEIPKNLRNDTGLLYELLNYYKSIDDYDQIRKILSHDLSKCNYPDMWWKARVLQIRKLLEEKNYILAYNLSKIHGTKDDSNYVDGEWLSGWIALSFLNKPNIAYAHFVNLYENAKFPISKSRGAYWAGKASEKNKGEWFKKASLYPETFYGQLSLAKLGKNTLSFAPPPTISATDLSNYRNNELVKAAYLFIKLEKIPLAKIFLKASIRASKTPGEILLITELGHNMDALHLSVEAAKEAARNSVLITKTYYPVIDIDKSEIIENALVHAIIRQESVFDTNAESSAGALGLMQLMPNTARDLSKELNISHNAKHLKSKPSYNITLGSHYLQKIINNFNGSYILGICAYNAGVTNVKKWIEIYGDPRELSNVDEIINWIESIPFYETRGYVQRVLENLQSYRLITNNKLQDKLEIENDLIRGFSVNIDTDNYEEDF